MDIKTEKMVVEPAKEIENVRVFIRVRPLSSKEKEEGRRNSAAVDPVNNLIALDKSGETDNSHKLKPYKFDKIFPQDSKQADVYRIVAAPIVDKALNGYNGTIFAYGQTGTGKTYTMTGESSPELRGIIPNSFAQIFNHISKMTGERTYAVTASYVEIYNEEVRDLLSAKPHKKLTIAEAPGVGVYIKEVGGYAADSSESLTNVLDRGNKNRITRSTLMNESSSRSHAIFSINIECKNNLTNVTTYGRLNLVDLAGSERVSRTHATGERLKEASNINLSLSALGNVISALVDGKSAHIPYRNSKLTRLLQDSLGGNSKTAMIATVSPSELDYEESICTLRYAARVKYIKNTAVINSGVGIIESFEAEIADLQRRVCELSTIGPDEPSTSMEKPVKQKKLKDKAASEAKAEEMRKYEELLEKNKKEKETIETKIQQLQKKLLVGGENLFEKAQQQMLLLESSSAELENLEKTHQQLEEELSKKGAERIDVEEKYSSLQEEDSGLSRKIKKVQALLNEVKEEYADKEHEHQREMETLQDNSRLLTRELQLAKIMIDSYIPKDYYKQVELNMQWNNEAQEYQMKGVAYTGNNMKKAAIIAANPTPPKHDMKLIYHKYSEKKHNKKPMYERKMIPTPKKR